MTGEDVRELRKKLGRTQAQFWSVAGCGQSGGSRYESGREIPEPVVKLLTLLTVSEAKALKMLIEMRQAIRK